MTITFTIDYITPKQMDDLTIELFDFIYDHDYVIDNFEIINE